jgi:hypothetical protein
MARYKLDHRIDEFESCARALEWKFYPKDESGMIKWLMDFELFQKGHRKKVCPISILKSDDLQFTAIFDYSYTISANNSSRTYRQTVYFRYSKELALPHFVMVPEKWFHRLGTYFGMQDIDFTEYPKYSKNYLLQGKDEEYIRHHFNHPGMIKFFDLQDFYSVEGMNYLFVVYIHDHLMPVKEILSLVKVGNTIHEYLKEKTPAVELPPFEI